MSLEHSLISQQEFEFLLFDWLNDSFSFLSLITSAI